MSDRRIMQAQAATIDAVLKQHRVPSHVGRSLATPRTLRYELTAEGAAPVQSVEDLAGEIAVALGASSAQVRRSNDGVYVEVPQPPQALKLLPLCDQLQRAPAVTAVLGVDNEGAPLLLRLPAPDVGNVLIAGMTGAGKTALARTMLTSLAIFNQTTQIQIVLIDPKARGFAHLQGLPHVLGELVSTEEEVRDCLRWLLEELDRRTAAQITKPALVVAIDELADLIQTGGRTIEAMLARLCDGGLQFGIHLIACAQKPTAELIGSAVKANFPVRLVGAVASREEARYATGINDSGAEQLAGKGDFLLVAAGQTVRFQAAWIGPKDLEHAKTLMQGNAIPTQWARLASLPSALTHAGLSTSSHRADAERANPSVARGFESGRTLWQSIIGKLAGF